MKNINSEEYIILRTYVRSSNVQQVTGMYAK